MILDPTDEDYQNNFEATSVCIICLTNLLPI